MAGVSCLLISMYLGRVDPQHEGNARSGVVRAIRQMVLEEERVTCVKLVRRGIDDTLGSALHHVSHGLTPVGDVIEFRATRLDHVNVVFEQVARREGHPALV